MDKLLECSSGDFAPGEESFYVNKNVYSRLLPEEIPQPEGKIYCDEGAVHCGEGIASYGEKTEEEISQG